MSEPLPVRELPRPGSAGAWILAARPKTLVAGWAPVLVGSSIAFAAGSFVPVRAVTALVVAVAIQIGTNLVNDAADYARGADTKERLGPPRAVANGLLTGRQAMAGGLACFTLAGLAGLWLASVSSWWLLVPGGLAILAGVAYTAGPKPLAYAGLGEIFVFAFFGLVAVLGTVYVQGAAPGLVSGAFGMALGLLAVAILEVNNIRDLPTDAAAGKATLAVRVGDRGARRLFLGCLAGAYVCVLAPQAWFGVVPAPMLWLPLLSIPLAAGAGRAVREGAGGTALNPVLARVVRLETVFAGLAAIGFVLVGSIR